MSKHIALLACRCKHLALYHIYAMARRASLAEGTEALRMAHSAQSSGAQTHYRASVSRARPPRALTSMSQSSLPQSLTRHCLVARSRPP